MPPQFEISRRLALAGGLALILSALLNFACARAATPRLTATPASGASGASVQVNDTGFTSNARVSLTWDGAALDVPDIVAGPGGAFSYDECDNYTPFVAAGKPIFENEYELETSDFCAAANALKKDEDLTAQRVACR